MTPSRLDPTGKATLKVWAQRCTSFTDFTNYNIVILSNIVYTKLHVERKVLSIAPCAGGQRSGREGTDACLTAVPSRCFPILCSLILVILEEGIAVK